jgi:cyclase
MLTKRIIACLDVHAGRVVKGVQFVDLRRRGRSGDAGGAPCARGRRRRLYCSTLRRRMKGRQTLLDTVRRTARELFVPFCVGGGIKSARDAEQVFEAGADKVSINSAALYDPDLIGARWPKLWRAGCGGCHRRRRDPEAARLRCAMRRCTSPGDAFRPGSKVVEWAREAEERGAGEIHADFHGRGRHARGV